MKILVIRLSSIGDVVLTSPIVRCLHQIEGVEVHFMVKSAFTSVVSHNPYITKVIPYDGLTPELRETLRQEHYDRVIDLQRNARSRSICRSVAQPRTTFPKQNFARWLYVTLKRPLIPITPVVDRYFRALRGLGVKNDGMGLDFFFEHQDLPRTEAAQALKNSASAEQLQRLSHPTRPYVVIVVGANHTTKTIPPSFIHYLASGIQADVVLIGGKGDRERLGNEHLSWPDHVINLCGTTSISQSAYLMKHARMVISPDTGMMHIATALQVRMVVVWGNTTPLLGFAPYLPQEAPDGLVVSMQVDGLSCQPCSKLGKKKCPRGHFRCMKDQPWQQLVLAINHVVSQEN